MARPAQLTPGRKYRITASGKAERDSRSRRNRLAVAALVSVVANPTTTQPTWRRRTTSKAAPVGWWCTPDIFSHDGDGEVIGEVNAGDGAAGACTGPCTVEIYVRA